MKIPANEFYHVYRVYFQARTYDADYADEILVYVDFEVEATAKHFKKYFHDLCFKNSLYENHDDVFLGNIVHFENLDRYLDNNKRVMFRGEIYEMTNPYSTGWIYIDNSKVVEVTHSHTEKEI